MGGRGSAGVTGIRIGEGIRFSVGGKDRVYFADASGVLRNLQSGETLRGGKAAVNALLKNGATKISKKVMDGIKLERNVQRSSRPDYELGNVFNERSKRKSIYRPRRNT